MTVGPFLINPVILGTQANPQGRPGDNRTCLGLFSKGERFVERQRGYKRIYPDMKYKLFVMKE